jgi:hypothetical protein
MPPTDFPWPVNGPLGCGSATVSVRGGVPSTRCGTSSAPRPCSRGSSSPPTCRGWLGMPTTRSHSGLARLRGLVEPVPQACRVLLVTGEAGMGKTMLLADTAERARSAGMRVLSVTGRESESNLAFAGLHQLLRPMLSSRDHRDSRDRTPNREARSFITQRAHRALSAARSAIW